MMNQNQNTLLIPEEIMWSQLFQDNKKMSVSVLSHPAHGRRLERK